MNTHSTSANQHDECAMKRISTHASIINLSSRVGERVSCAAHTLCFVVRLCCEDSDSDSSMLVMHVQNKDTVHRRPILLEMKETDTVGAFWMCCMSPWKSDIDNKSREREREREQTGLALKCWDGGVTVCRNDETS